MKQKIITSEAVYLLNLEICRKHPRMTLSIQLSGSEDQITFIIYTKNGLIDLLTSLNKKTGFEVVSVESITRKGVANFCPTNSGDGGKSVRMWNREKLSFIEMFHNLNIWDAIKQSGFHELLPQDYAT